MRCLETIGDAKRYEWGARMGLTSAEASLSYLAVLRKIGT